MRKFLLLAICFASMMLFSCTAFMEEIAYVQAGNYKLEVNV